MAELPVLLCSRSVIRFIPFAVGQSDATLPNPLLAGREVLWSDLVAPQHQPVIFVF